MMYVRVVLVNVGSVMVAVSLVLVLSSKDLDVLQAHAYGPMLLPTEVMGGKLEAARRPVRSFFFK